MNDDTVVALWLVGGLTLVATVLCGAFSLIAYLLRPMPPKEPPRD